MGFKVSSSPFCQFDKAQASDLQISIAAEWVSSRSLSAYINNWRVNYDTGK